MDGAAGEGRRPAALIRGAAAVRGNPFVYVSYPKTGEKGTTLAVARGFLKGDELGDIQEIFVADAWERGGNLAGRVFFGKDKNLYVTIGDRDRLCCLNNGKEDNSLRMKAQALDNHVGKTLRLTDEGTAPPDNPFVGRAGAKPEIYTYGHRNGYGLTVHPDTGDVWQAEIGPLGGDEVNILLPGTHCGNITIRNGATLQLLPGEYYFTSGQLQMMNNSTLTGSKSLVIR